MKNAVVQRLKEILNERHLSNRSVADAIGMTESTLNGKLNGSRGLDIDTLIKIVTHFELPVDVIMLGKDNCKPIVNFERGVPYYNEDFTCGFDIVENSHAATPDCLIWFPKYDMADCWCNATGMSMYPSICPGDIIALKELKDWRTYIPKGEIYAIVTTEHRTIKRICSSNIKGHVRLVPINKSGEFSDEDIPVSIIRRVYKVLGCLKRF